MPRRSLITDCTYPGTVAAQKFLAGDDTVSATQTRSHLILLKLSAAVPRRLACRSGPQGTPAPGKACSGAGVRRPGHCSKHSLAKNRILGIPAQNPASENAITGNALLGERFSLKFVSTCIAGVGHSGQKSVLNSSFTWLRIRLAVGFPLCIIF